MPFLLDSKSKMVISTIHRLLLYQVHENHQQILEAMDMVRNKQESGYREFSKKSIGGKG